MNRQQQLVAEAVRRRRRELGWTQAELAERVGVHTQSIGNLERASHATSPELLIRVQQALDIDLSTTRQAARMVIDAISDDLYSRIERMDPTEAVLMVGMVQRFIASGAWRGGPPTDESPPPHAPRPRSRARH